MIQKAKAAQRRRKQRLDLVIGTSSSALNLADGVLTVTVTESPDWVYVAITGARARPYELLKFLQFMEEVWTRYEEIGGQFTCRSMIQPRSA